MTKTFKGRWVPLRPLAGAILVIMPCTLGIAKADPLEDLEARVGELESDLATLRGKVESLELRQSSQAHTTQVQTESVPPSTEAASSPTLSPSGESTNPSPHQTPATLETQAPPEEVQAYDAALKQLKDSEFPLALASFQSFLSKYPHSPLNEFVLYWVGVIQMIQHDYDSAQETFGTLLTTYPHTQKRPDIDRKLWEIKKKTGTSPGANETPL